MIRPRRCFELPAITLIAMVVLTAPALATPGPDAEVYGSWIAMDVENQGMRMISTFTIHPDHIQVTSRCSFGDKQVEATTSVPAVVTSREIVVTETRDVEKEYSPGFLNCRARIKPMTVNYAVEHDKLVLSMPGTDQTHALNRAPGS